MIKTYLSGVRQIQISHGFNEPRMDSMSKLHQVIKGVKVEQGKLGKALLLRLPITPTILRKTKRVWKKRGNTFDNTMLWAVGSTTFFRSGVDIEDIQTSHGHQQIPSIILIHIKYSNNNGFLGVTSTFQCLLIRLYIVN